MKLEENKIEVDSLRYKMFVAIVTLGFGGLVIKTLISYFQGNESMLVFAILYAIIPVISIFLFRAVTRGNIDNAKIKEIGQKVQGEIVEVKKLKRFRSYTFSQCLIVVFDGKTTMVCDMLENEALSVLKMLLDEYPFQTVTTVPVDVYTYKRKVFVDLESVDLSKVDGYEDAVKLVEDMNDDMTM